MIYWLILIFVIAITSFFKIGGKRLLYIGLFFVFFGSVLDILNLGGLVEPLFRLGLTVWVVGIVKTWSESFRKKI